MTYNLCSGMLYPAQSQCPKPAENFLTRWNVCYLLLQETAEFADLEDEPDIACHFSLKVPVYVQFTSPIRRFMDIVIHRYVTAALDNEPAPYSLDEVGISHLFLTI